LVLWYLIVAFQCLCVWKVLAPSRRFLLVDTAIFLLRSNSLAVVFRLVPPKTYFDVFGRSAKLSISLWEILSILGLLAKKMREEKNRGIQLNLTEEEVAFYDALADNESAKQFLGDKTLKLMSHELVEMIRKNVTVDWTLRDSVQAKLRVMVRHLLKNYGYPPDKQEKATFTVFEQAKLLCKDWAETNC
jgi:hypothetical protein